MRNQPKEGKIG